jgi:site-specific recombinase XerD
MTITFSYLVTTFFTSHLSAELNLSDNSIASYSDCMTLLIDYVCKRFNIQPEAIDLSTITPELVLDFLQALKKERGNAPSTCNQRLAAIKTFFHFIAKHVPELMLPNERIQAIKLKKTEHLPPPSLIAEEVDAILSTPDQNTLIGARDAALLQVLYNTGARVQELADIALLDLRFGSAPSVTVTGKGRKTRVIPLWQESVDIISRYVNFRKQEGIESEHLFINTKGEPLTRSGIGRRVTLHATTAAKHSSSLQGRSITPHTFRHTTALHLIEAGNDIAVVKDWLGHGDIKTTSQYLEISIERKRKALEKLPPPDGGLPPEAPQWKQPDVLKFLNRCSRQARYVA